MLRKVNTFIFIIEFIMKIIEFIIDFQFFSMSDVLITFILINFLKIREETLYDNSFLYVFIKLHMIRKWKNFDNFALIKLEKFFHRRSI